MTDIIQELRTLIAKATPGPWAYRPREYDDWGFIRVAQADAEGWQPIVALGRAGPVESDHDEHRRNKTDPYGPNAELIVAAINHLPALLDRLEAAERGVDFLDMRRPIKGMECRSNEEVFAIMADRIRLAEAGHYRLPAIREVKP